ncbi:DUF4426 domain-containing protein [Alteromonadaceae bacterium BrNp21-10]|nr:DUF4426 domain-containing protein [Alteromonadaceae bacterium BrNp21-10]
MMLRQFNAIVVSLWLLAVLSALITPVALAEQKVTLGDWDVHYIVLPSTFLTPDVAKAYGLQRSRYQSLINISVLDSKSQLAQSVVVSGTAKNLLGNVRKLEFQEVKEQQSIYYLAQLPLDGEELWRFEITVRHGDTSETLKFKQKLYIEE